MAVKHKSEVEHQALPRFMISAPQGHSGKTIVSIGICAALADRGFAVQPFKKGPDYIDPSWLSLASDRDCRNLDSFLLSESLLISSFKKATVDADIAIIEGSMGLFDSSDPTGKGSSADIARLFDKHMVVIKSELLRQADGLTLSVLKKLRCFHWSPL